MSLIMIDLFGIGDCGKMVWGWIVIGLLLASFIVSLIIAIKETKKNANKKPIKIKIILG